MQSEGRAGIEEDRQAGRDDNVVRLRRRVSILGEIITVSCTHDCEPARSQGPQENLFLVRLAVLLRQPATPQPYEVRRRAGELFWLE